MGWRVTGGGYKSSFTQGWWRTLIGVPSGCVNSMWFVYVLFCLKLLDLFWEKIRASFSLTMKPIVILFLLIITIIVFFPGIKIPRPINWILASYPFLLAGKVLRHYEYLLNKLGVVMKILITATLLIIPVLGVKYNGFVDLYLWTFGNNMYMYYIIGILSSIGMFCLFRLFVDILNKFIRIISEGTIMIIAYHKLILYFLLDYNTIFIYRFCICLLLVLLFYLPIIFSYKYFPILIGKKKIRI